MSKTNQVRSSLPNPCQLWYEWSSKDGNVKHYDKDKKENITTKLPFKFMLLDEFSTVKGWDDASQSSIYSNEVKSTGTEPLRVSASKGGVLVEGLYKDIKDRVKALGGAYNKNLYITQGDSIIASLILKGSALSSWMDFVKENKSEIYSKAIVITEGVSAKKGAVTFKTPKFEFVEATAKEEEDAINADKELQEFVNSKTGVVLAEEVLTAEEELDKEF